MKDLAIEYMPQNPSAGDSLLITVSELETGIPVELLSVVVIGDEFTEFSGLTNYNGQISFTLSEGTFLVRASGGMYNPIDFTIVVTQDGSRNRLQKIPMEIIFQTSLTMTTIMTELMT